MADTPAQIGSFVHLHAPTITALILEQEGGSSWQGPEGRAAHSQRAFTPGLDFTPTTLHLLCFLSFPCKKKKKSDSIFLSFSGYGIPPAGALEETMVTSQAVSLGS